MDDTKHLPDVLPSAAPSDAEIEAWQSLSREEQARRLQLALSHPDCDAITNDTIEDIVSEARKRWAEKTGDV